MAMAMTVPNYPRNTKFSAPKSSGNKSTAAVLSFAVFFHQSTMQSWFVNTPKPSLVQNLRRRMSLVRSSVDDPSSTNGTTGRTRLFRTIQAFQNKLGSRIEEIRKNLPMKVLFFLVGFYCSTAFSTVIGQTGDWDILSAALAVVVVEGIGALMYRASISMVGNIRRLITMFNYWKAGLTMGLFLDSFKY